MTPIYTMRDAVRQLGMGTTPEPEQMHRQMQRQQQRLDMLEAGATQQPQNVGQGMSAIAQALAYRKVKGQMPQAQGATPWAVMRQSGALAPEFSGSVMKLFGAGN